MSVICLGRRRKQSNHHTIKKYKEEALMAFEIKKMVLVLNAYLLIVDFTAVGKSLLIVVDG